MYILILITLASSTTQANNTPSTAKFALAITHESPELLHEAITECEKNNEKYDINAALITIANNWHHARYTKYGIYTASALTALFFSFCATYNTCLRLQQLYTQKPPVFVEQEVWRLAHKFVGITAINAYSLAFTAACALCSWSTHKSFVQHEFHYVNMINVLLDSQAGKQLDYRTLSPAVVQFICFARENKTAIL